MESSFFLNMASRDAAWELASLSSPCVTMQVTEQPPHSLSWPCFAFDITLSILFMI